MKFLLLPQFTRYLFQEPDPSPSTNFSDSEKLNFRRLSIFLFFSPLPQSMKNRGICRRGTDVFVHFTIIELDGYRGTITASKTETYQTTPRTPGSFLFLKTPLLQRVGVLWFPSVTPLEVLQSCWSVLYRRQNQPTAIHTYKASLIMTGFSPSSACLVPPRLPAAVVSSSCLSLCWVFKAFLSSSHQPSPNTLSFSASCVLFLPGSCYVPVMGTDLIAKHSGSSWRYLLALFEQLWGPLPVLHNFSC